MPTSATTRNPARKKPAARKTTARKKAPAKKKPAPPRATKTSGKRTSPVAATADNDEATASEGFVILLDPPPQQPEKNPASTAQDEGFVILLDSPAPAAPPAGTARLGADCTLGKLVSVHATLLELLDHDGHVTLDVSTMGAHDSAFVQLLCAFERSARSKKLEVRYAGDTTAVAATAQSLALHSHLSL